MKRTNQLVLTWISILFLGVVVVLSRELWPHELRVLFTWSKALDWLTAIGTIGAALVALWLGLESVRRTERSAIANARLAAVDILADTWVLLLRVQESKIAVESVLYGGQDASHAHLKATYATILRIPQPHGAPQLLPLHVLRDAKAPMADLQFVRTVIERMKADQTPDAEIAEIPIRIIERTAEFMRRQLEEVEVRLTRARAELINFAKSE